MSNIVFYFCSEVGGRTLYRLLCRDAGGETEGTLLTETVPTWVADIVVNRNLPKLIKVPFYLLPHPASGIKCVKKYRRHSNFPFPFREINPNRHFFLFDSGIG